MSAIWNREEEADSIYADDIMYALNDIDIAENELKHQFEWRERYANEALESTKRRIEWIIEKLSRLY